VFSHPICKASASSAAAVADGANSITDPGPWVASQVRRNASKVVVLPVPAGPTRTSNLRPEVAMAVTEWERVQGFDRPRKAGMTAGEQDQLVVELTGEQHAKGS
jgi:hypothetical protein